MRNDRSVRRRDGGALRDAEARSPSMRRRAPGAPACALAVPDISKASPGGMMVRHDG
jgi:hypothetical protein